MNKRNMIALMLVLALLLAGCGQEAPRQGGTVTPATPTTENLQDNAAPSQEETEPAQDQHVSLGSMEGGIYENTYTGYGCTLGQGWVYKTAEELQDITGMTQELLDGTALDEEFGDQYSQITDMMAENQERLLSMNVQYTRLSPQERVLHAAMTTEDLVDSTLSQKDMLLQTYAQAGIDVSSMEKVSVQFLGEERWAIHTSATIQGTPYYILQLFEINLGNYFVTLTLASFVEDNTSSMLELFYPV